MALERHYMGVTDATRVLCTAYWQLCLAVSAAGVIKDIEPAFGSAQMRYEQRFECFVVVENPEYLWYESMKDSIDPTSTFQRL
jgi:hypothetical protein